MRGTVYSITIFQAILRLLYAILIDDPISSIYSSLGVMWPWNNHRRVRWHKLNTNHTTTGIFLEFTATDRTIRFEDKTTGKLKPTHHAIFDEAHYSSDNRPPYTQTLMDLAEEHLTNHKKLSPPSSDKQHPQTSPQHTRLILDNDASTTQI